MSVEPMRMEAAVRRTVWIWVIVAFFIGLLPGAATTWWVHQSNVTSRQTLLKRTEQLSAENQQLQAKLNSAEASVTDLQQQAQQPQAPTPSSPSTSGSGSGEPTGAPNITARTVTPDKAAPGASMTLEVKLTGRAERVNMRITGPGGLDKTYFLARSDHDSAGETWRKVIGAPKTAGTYNYYGIAYDAAGKKYPMPGTGYIFTVQ